MKKSLSIVAAFLFGLEAFAQQGSVLQKADSLKRMYRIDEAIALLEDKLSSEDGGEEATLASLADCHFQNASLPEALSLYDALSVTSPSNTFYKIRRMLILSRMKKYGECVSQGREILSKDTIPQVVSFVGDAFRQMGQRDSAIAYYRRSLSLRPDRSSVVNKLGTTLVEEKMYREATTLAKDYLSRHPDDASILSLLGVSAHYEGRYGESVKALKKVRELGDDSFGVASYLGMDYEEMKIFELAEDEYLKALEKDSTSVQTICSLATVRQELGEDFPSRVKPLYDKAASLLEPDHRTMYNISIGLAKGYFSVKDYRASIREYENAYRYEPSSKHTLVWKGYCHQLLGEYEKAKDCYEQYLKVGKKGDTYDFAAENLSVVKSELFMGGK